MPSDDDDEDEPEVVVYPPNSQKSGGIHLPLVSPKPSGSAGGGNTTKQEEVYANLAAEEEPEVCTSKPIKVSELGAYIEKKKKQKDGFKDEFGVRINV